MAGINLSDRKETLFLEALGSPVIDMNNLRKLCSTGIVETCGIRTICWRLLLNCLPKQRTKWPEALEKQRCEYQQFLNEMIIEPGLKRCNAAPGLDDHPLNPNPTSEWNSYFKDNDILLQIDKDVRRLCPDIAFFQNATAYPCEPLVSPTSRLENLRKRVERSVLSSQNLTRKRLGISNLISSRKQASREYDTLEEGQEAHWEVVERILFIYAKLNPGTAYVQGMNEIIGPLYYTLASDPNLEWKEHAEADTFFCFTNLMGEIRDNFIKSLDKSGSGIEASMNRVLCLLRQVDPEVWLRLDSLAIKPQFYLFRWITLLLSQEFSLPDVIHIWDILFSDSRRFDFLIAVCSAMIILLRDEILTRDFSHNMKLLQNYPLRIDVNTIISKAKEIYHNLRN
ncbi:TBC1 domain family member 13-like [Clavelina lepadiformis]|uniref:Rab-GAP TBC domain-containing protein n=1 Tax=Clavelina lepadiformis TaxID=159417 RepID=A0ABP0F922_CLALP